MEDIIESWINGQRRQMVKQIEEYGVYNFSADIFNSDISVYDQRDILRCFLMLTYG